jgi:hypothetical protein
MKNGKLITYDTNICTSQAKVKNLLKRDDLTADKGITLEDIAYAQCKGNSPPSPAYAKKLADGSVRMFSCIEKLEEFLEQKAAHANDMNYKFADKCKDEMQREFFDKFCGPKDAKCQKDAYQTLGIICNNPNQLSDEKILSRSLGDFETKLAFGCFLGFEEIRADEALIEALIEA